MRTGREVAVFVHREGQVLLLRRARDGIWHVPAGVVEAGETSDEAAARELQEETGLTAARLVDLRCTQRYPSDRERYVYPPESNEVRLENFSADAPPGWEPRLDAEHTDARWVRLEEVGPLLNWDNTREALGVLSERLAHRPDDPTRWLDGSAPALGPQARVLRQLIAEAQGDQRIRVLVVGCSIGRGVADEHSDIDAYMAVVPDAWPAYVADPSEPLARLGTLLDRSQKRVAAFGREPYELVWGLFADGVQLELVVAQARPEIRPRRDWVILHDPDGRVTEVQPDQYATAEQVREWAYDGWSTLMLCAKYLARGSLWEALETLHVARTQAWRLWAAARHVADPQYGLTAVLDSVDPSPPPGIGTTHAPLERTALMRAALACADLMNDLWTEATLTVSGSAAPVPPAGTAARRKLAELGSSRA